MIKLNPPIMLLAVLTLSVGISCSHKFDPDILDLDFYQWNLWYDISAESGQVLPSCGWEDLHRGMGKLVRIPAMAAEHLPGEQPGGVLWYHCRFTLPENWEGRLITLQINGVAPVVELFLNMERIAEYSGKGPTFEIDVSDRIYYTRDNHLAIKIRIPEGNDWDQAGISGGVKVISVIEDHTIYQERDGQVIIEAESGIISGNWMAYNSSEEFDFVAGYSGEGCIRFTGNTEVNGPPDSPISYSFRISTPGTYRIKMRGLKAHMETGEGDKANDCYVRLDGAEGWLGEFTKFVLLGESYTWWWNILGEPAYHEFEPPEYKLAEGEYRIQIAGRSRNFFIDKIVLYNTELFDEQNITGIELN